MVWAGDGGTWRSFWQLSGGERWERKYICAVPGELFSCRAHMKYWSQTFIPTLKESPSDAEIASHKLLLRAGLVRKLGGGLYTFLPSGLRVMQKISQLCREEMDRAGAIELSMPFIHPAENWQEGPRWAAAREIMYRVDRAGAGKGRSKEPEFVLGPTHEEVITPLVKSEITSYRDLPKNFYQIGTKFRNEIRPRFGLMRAREFVMKDAYSFDATDEGAIESYNKMKARLLGVLRPLRLEDHRGRGRHRRDGRKLFPRVHGAGADRRRRHRLLRGERLLAPIARRRRAASCRRISPTPRRRARSRNLRRRASSRSPRWRRRRTACAADKQFKTLVYMGDGKPFLVILRGCDELEEAKLGALGLPAVAVRPRRRKSSRSWARSPAASARSRARSRIRRRWPAFSPTTRSASSATARPARTRTVSTCAT